MGDPDDLSVPNTQHEMETDKSASDKASDSSLENAPVFDENNLFYRQIKIIDMKMQCLAVSASELNCPEAAEQDLVRLNQLQEQFDRIIEECGDENVFTLRLNFARKYRELRDGYFKVISLKRKAEHSSVVSDSCLPLKLPTLDIPKFSGDLEKWAAFKDLFMSLVKDSRVRDNDSAKRYYLFQALSGDALSIIENLQEADFSTAWNLLVQFYDDPFRRAKNHYEAVFKAKRRGQTQRQRLITYRQHITGLRAAYAELNLDPFEQAVIMHFLDEPETKQSLRLEWERRVTSRKSDGTLEDFFQFVEQETTSTERASNKQFAAAGPSKKEHSFFQTQQKKKIRVCYLCSESTHYTNQCASFRKLSIDERINFIREKKLCAVCFSNNCRGASQHPAACFKKNLFCVKCKKPHNTLLHKSGESNFALLKSNPAEVSLKNSGDLSVSKLSVSVENATELVKTIQKDPLPVCMLNKNVQMLTEYKKEPLLATAVVEVIPSQPSQNLECRALLDNGSQFNFITKGLVKKLGLSTFPANTSVSSISSNMTAISKGTKITIKSRFSEFNLNISCLVVDHIVNSMIPSQFFEIDSWNLPYSLHLADPGFNVPAEIDLLLGLDVFWQVLRGQSMKLRSGLPHLQATLFGWIIAGSIRLSTTKSGQLVFLIQPNNNELLESIQKFWLIEKFESASLPLSKEDAECERLFTSNTYRQEDGRFVVSLPFKQDPSLLGDSRKEALKQFYQLERRLQNNTTMKENYISCVEEYLSLGHMRILSNESNDSPNYYFPHHAVTNLTSTSTKQRTVFNGSMKTTSGYSLNDLLYTGPVVQPELISILIRFRIHTYVMSADIVKMYRQIRINPEQTAFQRLFWRDSPNKPLNVYELDTLTFGERPAPFLATRCLNELAIKYGDSFPEAKSVILHDFYVDNLLTGSNSLVQARSIQEQLIKLLDSAGFPLSKWCSNNSTLLANIDEKHLETKFQVTIEDKEMVKTLGMYWVPSDDSFRIWFDRSDVTESKTKRQILSVIASIFDPMGLIGPVTVLAKCFMQEVWKQTVENSELKISTQTKKRSTNIHWDEKVNDGLLEPWKRFSSQLYCLNQISIPRYIMLPSSNQKFELHGFADASSKAYGAVIYSRVIDPSSSNVRVSIICSKSRVAPLKQLSIARLELCAAVLLAELADKVASIFSLNLNVDTIRLWSDSKVTLSWIGSPSYKWSVFVAHRVSKIQSLSENCQWDYVESSSNPADLLSRGVNPQELTADHEWFLGPSWLRSSTEPWAETVSFSPNQNEMEERKPVKGFTMTVVPFKSDIFKLAGQPMTRSNSVEWAFKQGFSKLVRLVAYLTRFRLNTQPFFPKAVGLPKDYELERARIVLIKLSQAEVFSKEISCLSKNQPLDKGSSIYSLNPRLDKNGVLIVGGRLSHADMSFEQRHPALLHPSHKLTSQIIMHEHLTHLHANPRLLRSILRRKYWIIRINGAISKCLKTCHTCLRFAAKTQDEIMADLPRSRVVPSKPFTHTGVDYAGPVQYVVKGGRKAIVCKAYIAVFVCFATKAIHLELVSDLTSNSFIAALKRFISRRGIPMHLHSDNGTTFVGAKNQLNEIYAFVKQHSNEFENFAINQGFQWHFIPPYSPHFGGIWEASVKSVKNHLRRSLGSASLNFEDFSTLLAQIEACLNSRPLTAESSDPNELNALTPGHFLIGGPIMAIPNRDLTTTPDNRLDHWHMVNKLTQLFWQRWRVEYLNSIQQRYKWRIVKNEVKVNDLVILKEDNLPPAQWRTGRIIELHPSRDGLNRVVTLRTAAGNIKRPLTKLILLPPNDQL